MVTYKRAHVKVLQQATNTSHEVQFIQYMTGRKAVGVSPIHEIEVESATTVTAVTSYRKLEPSSKLNLLLTMRALFGVYVVHTFQL